jgi:cobalt-zinc-cadmium efflux system membrane fusion protein
MRHGRFGLGTGAARPAALLVLCALVACSHDGEPVAEHAPDGEHADEHAGEVSLAPETLREQDIALERATRRVLRPTFLVPAQVAFNQEAMAHVGCPVAGRVVELSVKLGDPVQKGDVLLVVESPDLGAAQSDYLVKRSAVETAGPAVELAQQAWERGKRLHEESQGLALSEVQQREGELRAAQAVREAARTTAQAAAHRLSLLGMGETDLARLEQSGAIDPRFRVRAPIDGQVIEREVTLGHLVGPEREALLVLADVSRSWVLADVPEARLGELAVGAPARVLLGAAQEHWCEGQVTYLSPALDPTTRSMRVRIEALDQHAELRPGVFAQVEIEATRPGGAEAESVVVVPESALQRIDGEPAVFVPVPGEPGTFARRGLRVGRAVGGFVPVLAGLAEGEEFVARGSFLLKAELGKSGAEHEH